MSDLESKNPLVSVLAVSRPQSAWAKPDTSSLLQQMRELSKANLDQAAHNNPDLGEDPVAEAFNSNLDVFRDQAKSMTRDERQGIILAAALVSPESLSVNDLIRLKAVLELEILDLRQEGYWESDLRGSAAESIVMPRMPSPADLAQDRERTRMVGIDYKLRCLGLSTEDKAADDLAGQALIGTPEWALLAYERNGKLGDLIEQLKAGYRQRNIFPPSPWYGVDDLQALCDLSERNSSRIEPSEALLACAAIERVRDQHPEVFGELSSELAQVCPYTKQSLSDGDNPRDFIKGAKEFGLEVALSRLSDLEVARFAADDSRYVLSRLEQRMKGILLNPILEHFEQADRKLQAALSSPWAIDYLSNQAKEAFGSEDTHSAVIACHDQTVKVAKELEALREFKGSAADFEKLFNEKRHALVRSMNQFSERLGSYQGSQERWADEVSNYSAAAAAIGAISVAGIVLAPVTGGTSLLVSAAAGAAIGATVKLSMVEGNNIFNERPVTLRSVAWNVGTGSVIGFTSALGVKYQLSAGLRLKAAMGLGSEASVGALLRAGYYGRHFLRISGPIGAGTLGFESGAITLMAGGSPQEAAANAAQGMAIGFILNPVSQVAFTGLARGTQGVFRAGTGVVRSVREGGEMITGEIFDRFTPKPPGLVFAQVGDSALKSPRLTPAGLPVVSQTPAPGAPVLPVGLNHPVQMAAAKSGTGGFKSIEDLEEALARVRMQITQGGDPLQLRKLNRQRINLEAELRRAMVRNESLSGLKQDLTNKTRRLDRVVAAVDRVSKELESLAKEDPKLARLAQALEKLRGLQTALTREVITLQGKVYSLSGMLRIIQPKQTLAQRLEGIGSMADDIVPKVTAETKRNLSPEELKKMVERSLLDPSDSSVCDGMSLEVQSLLTSRQHKIIEDLAADLAWLSRISKASTPKDAFKALLEASSPQKARLKGDGSYPDLWKALVDNEAIALDTQLLANIKAAQVAGKPPYALAKAEVGPSPAEIIAAKDKATGGRAAGSALRGGARRKGNSLREM